MAMDTGAVPPLPMPRSALAAVSVGQRIYAIGGFESPAGFDVPSNTVYAYDLNEPNAG